MSPRLGFCMRTLLAVAVCIVVLPLSGAGPLPALDLSVPGLPATVAAERGFPSTLTGPWTDCSEVAEIPLVECQALVDLYNQTNGSSWSGHTGWLQTDTPCSWKGVTCQVGHVTQLNLQYNYLSGSIPSSLGGLANLEQLYLNGNGLTGSIPETLGNLGSLQELYLSINHFSGSIPSTLGNLGRLRALWLQNNQLSGSIPDTLGNLGSLAELYLFANELSGSIPGTLGNLGSLRALWLQDNQLSGSIPDTLGNLGNLQELYLWDNQLSGSIPDTLGNLGKLLRLDLSANRLGDSIPSTLGNLSNLEELHLDSNQLSGTVPSTLGNLRTLQELSLCCQPLQGPLPGTLTELHLTWFHFHATSLCEPADAAFQDWLRTIPNLARTNVLCPSLTPRCYLPLALKVAGHPLTSPTARPSPSANAQSKTSAVEETSEVFCGKG